MPAAYELTLDEASEAVAAHGAKLDAAALRAAGAPAGEETVDLLRLAAWLVRDLKARDHGAAEP